MAPAISRILGEPQRGSRRNRFIPVAPAPTARELDVLAETNRARATWQRRPVAWDSVLALVARLHAGDMVSRDYFAHVAPDGRSLADRVGRVSNAYRLLGENLAGGHSSGAAAVAGWMNSAGHRENLLRSDFNRVGVAVVNGGRWGIVWVQVFGTPFDATVTNPAPAWLQWSSLILNRLGDQRGDRH
jgi:uncharacterized protein YkwD